MAFDGQAKYVIVGAGSAGCVLAARLTEDPHLRVIDTTSAACHHVEQNTLQAL